MLTRKTPETLATEITVTGQGMPDFKFNLTYWNRTQEEITAKLEEGFADPRNANDPQFANRQLLIYMVKDWESEYELTDADVKQMEKDRPGMIELIFTWFHMSRRVELVKN